MDKSENNEGYQLTKIFGVVSPSKNDKLIAVAMHLARVEAEKDYKKFLKLSKKSYDAETTKGLRHD